jgi:hypothetical protein
MEDTVTDLSPEDSALLDAARDGHEPTKRDRARVRAALIAQLGVGTGLTAVTTSTTAAGAGLAATSSGAVGVVAKLVAATALVGALGGTGALAYRIASGPSSGEAIVIPTQPSTPSLRESVVTPAPKAALAALPSIPLPAAQSASPNRPGAPSNASPVPPRREGPENPSTPTVNTGGAAARGALAAAVPGEPASAPQAQGSAFTARETLPAEPATPTTLEDETRLVRGGINALHARDAAGALALFDEHARSYPNGVLAEERAAERISALCDLGRLTEASSAAASFLREHPHSPLASRVSVVCGQANP